MHLCVCALNVSEYTIRITTTDEIAPSVLESVSIWFEFFVPENYSIFSSIFFDSDLNLALSTRCQFISGCSSQCMTKQYVNACLVSPRSHLLDFNESKLYPCSTLFDFKDGTLMKRFANEWGCFCLEFSFPFFLSYFLFGAWKST